MQFSNLLIIVRIILTIWMITLIQHSIHAEEINEEPCFLTVVTHTGNKKHDGTDDLSIFILINDDENQKHRLDNPNINDFRVGAADKFENLQVDCDLKKIERIVLKIEAGADAWRIRKITFQLFKGNLKSEIYTFKTNTALSAEKEDKAKKKKAFLFRNRSPIVLK